MGSRAILENNKRKPEFFVETVRMLFDSEARNQTPCKMMNFKWALGATEKCEGKTVAIFYVHLKPGTEGYTASDTSKKDTRCF